MTDLILASQSMARRSMLRAAGLDIETMSANVDEEALKDGLRFEGITARNLADSLAEAKALRASRRVGAGLVLGADQTLALDDGTMFDKADDPDGAKAQLRRLSGQTHRLFSAAVVADQGVVLWRHIEIAKLTVRVLSDSFIADYVDREWETIQHCVGCYAIEGRGVQLFSKIDGSHFAILGLPLLPLLDWLRLRGTLPS